MIIGIASTYYARHEGRVSSVDQRFAREAEARGARVVHVDPLACSYELTSGRVAIRLGGAPLDLDGLLVRRAAFHWNAVKTLVLMAHETGAACVDRPETFLGTLSGKFQALLRRYRLPEAYTPRSFLCFTRAGAAADPPPAGVYPLLRKPLRGSLGDGIVELPDAGALAQYVAAYDFDEPLMLQERVSGEEFRALMLGARCLGVVAKLPGRDGLGNVAQGAVFVPAAPERAAEVAALARTLMADAPYDFAAVDVIRNAGGGLCVLECNRNPHFAGFERALPDVDVAAAVIGFLLERVADRRREM